MTMRLHHLLLIPLLSAISLADNSPRPDALQKSFISRGYGMFIHFGINTFNDIEWSYGNLPVSSYQPTALDCDQWIRVAKEAGFRHVVLTTKHVDGFCLWDSKLTEYDVGARLARKNALKNMMTKYSTSGAATRSTSIGIWTIRLPL